MTQDPFSRTEALAKVWTVTTGDLRMRVAAAVGASPSTELADLLAEVRALRSEIAEIRLTTDLLHGELVRLRHDLAPRSVTRIAPYAGGDGLVRLS